MLEAALDGMVALLGADRASILLFGEDDRVHFVAWRGLSDGYRTAVDGHSPWQRGDHDAQPITVDDVATSDLEPELRATILGERVRALAFFPLARRESLLGKFMIYRVEPRPTSAEEIDLGKVVALHLAAALGRILDHEELQRREQHFRALIENSSDLIVLLDGDGLVTYESPAVEELAGYLPGERLGHSPFDLIHPDDHPRASAALDRLRHDPEFHDLVEFRVRHRDGGVRHLEIRGTNLLGHPAVGSLVLNIRDVTERYRAEEALALQHVYFRQLFENSPAAVAIADAEQRVEDVNPAFERLFGYARSECLGRPLSELVVPPAGETEDRELSRRVLAGEAVAVETTRRRADGAHLLALLRSFPVRLGSRQVGIFTTFEDVTERRRAEAALRSSEERYRKLFEESRDPIYISTPEGRMLDINPAGVQLFGFAGRDELLASDVRDLYWDAAQRDRFVADLRTHGFVNDLEVELRTRDGSKRRVLETATPVRDGDGELVAFRGTLHDVTERRELEEQLRQAQKMEAVGRLAGGVAHDFNNLLTAINGYSELLLRRFPAEDPARREAEEIHRSGRRAAELTRQLLALSRRQVLSPRTLDLNRALADMERLLRRVLGEDLDLGIALGASPAAVRCDPGQLEQVVLNLAVNARDAMPDGGRLEIATRNLLVDDAAARRHPGMQAGHYLEMRVTDTGVGMPADVLEHIFEPFFTTKERGKGTGLGLSTVYGIVRQSGGQVEATSRPGEGSTFRVLLPLADSLPEPDERRAVEAPPPPGRETVLLVEDERAVRQLLASALRAAGYRVIEAADGEQARQLATDDGTIDLLLTDLVMPRLGGVDLATALVAEQPTLRVVFISGYADRLGSPSLAGPLARAPFLQKPFPTGLLVRTVRAVLDESIDPPAEPPAEGGRETS